MTPSPNKAKDLTILIGCVLIMASTMGIVLSVTSIFYPVVSAHLGVSRSSFALTGTITALTSMVAALFWGGFYAKNAIQKPMLLGIAATSLCYFGLSTARTLLHFYLIAGVIGVLFSSISIIPVSIIMTRHFTRNTGSTLSLALAGSGLGPMLLNPIVNNLIHTHGWRSGYFLLSMVTLTVALPCAWLVTHLVRDEIQGAPIASVEAEQPKTDRTPFPIWFWAFLAAAFLSGLTGAGTLANLPIYMNDLHFSVSKISAATSAYAGSMLIGKFVLGNLYDRAGTKTGTFIAGLMMTLCCFFMIFIRSLPFLVLMLLTIGIGVAMGTVSITWMTNYFFGKQDYSKYFGRVQFANSLGSAAGIPLIALLLESVPQAYLIWLTVAGLSFLMLLLFMLSIRGNQSSRAVL